MDKNKIVYILGAGRSGSTLLGIMLGNLKSVFYPGELFAWNKYKGIPRTEKQDCKNFWREILENYNDSKKAHEYDFFNLMESYYSFKNLFRWFNKKVKTKYHDSNSELFEKIKEHTRALYIIDSSHYPLRAFWLLKNEKLDIKVIYLVRNPVQVVNAFLKKDVEQPPKHPLASNIYYFIVNLMSSIVYSMYPRSNRMIIRYEDVIHSPHQTVSRIASFIGTKNTIKTYDNLNVGHVFEGNRIRNNTRIGLNPKKTRIQLSPIWRIFTKLFQIPFNISFKYSSDIFKELKR